MSDVLMVAAISMGTYLTRLSAVALLGGERVLTVRSRHWLSMIAPAVLAAIVANSLFLDHSSVRPAGSWHVAATVAAAVGLWRKSLGLTIAAGMVTLLVVAAI